MQPHPPSPKHNLVATQTSLLLLILANCYLYCSVATHTGKSTHFFELTTYLWLHVISVLADSKYKFKHRMKLT